MWYDLRKIPVTTTFEEAVESLIGQTTQKKTSIKARARACALLKVADHIDRQHMVLLKELFAIYREEFRKEYLFHQLVNVYGYQRDTVKVIVAKNWNLDVGAQCEYQDQIDQHCVKILQQIPQMSYKSSDARDLFMNHLPVILVYKATAEKNVEGFILKRLSGVDWAKLVDDIEWPSKDKLIKTEIDKQIGHLLPKALQYSTEKDRHLLKLILTRLSSNTFLKEKGIGGMKFNDQCTRRDVGLAEASLEQWDSIPKSQRAKSRTSGSRLPGSGRIPLAKRYPELAELMLKIFDTGEGLQSHPRLICETLYLHQSKEYINMPRCVSILQDVYNIDISLSAAYTYTENFKSKTKQASRHHEGKGMNPGISLKKPTKDGSAKELSINDHYAQADVNYSLEQAFQNNAAIIARDDKALVHCDVQVVERPSKSWKRISYADHDWAKDTQRSLQITTYQFVELKQVNNTNEDILLGDVPICQTNLTGPGLSIVKTHFFESSTVYRHLNELLFVMTIEKFKKYFQHENGELTSQVLLTVDGGPDERPRNKTTQFACTLMRKLLELDKMKTISYAEGSSKRHSVERYHVVEGKALSQQGTVSSHSIHSSESDERGLYDMDKFRENMECAREDCIMRIDGTPYAGHNMTAVKPPPLNNWVISEETIKRLENFLAKDTTEHRITNNFVIRPDGPIWNEICTIYNITSSKAFSAISIFNDTNDPDRSWQQHYGFSSFRGDTSFRGKMLPFKEYYESGILGSSFDIQPLIDVGRLPEFHYLSYQQNLLLVKYFLDNSLELPKFLTCPDYYNPAVNIEYIHKEKPDMLNNIENLELLSTVIGVTPEAITRFVKLKEEKEALFQKRKCVKETYKDSCIGRLTVKQIKTALSDNGIHFTRVQDNKADLLILLDKCMKDSELSEKDFLSQY